MEKIRCAECEHCEEYREAEMPRNVLQKQRILVDALNFYLGGISEVMN